MLPAIPVNLQVDPVQLRRFSFPPFFTHHHMTGLGKVVPDPGGGVKTSNSRLHTGGMHAQEIGGGCTGDGRMRMAFPIAAALPSGG